MTRWIPAAAIVIVALGAPTMYAQAAKDTRLSRSGFPSGVLEGRVFDESHNPVSGAMVSVVGRATAVATTDRTGRYSLRELPFGPYIISVHLRGYYKSRGRTIQLISDRVSVPEIQLARARKESVEPEVADAVAVSNAQTTQLAGFGLDASEAVDVVQRPARATTESESEDGETAWRLRHLPRSVLKDIDQDEWSVDTEPSTSRWARYASAPAVPLAFFSELPLSGQLNLMTMDSFDSPSELFSAHTPRSVAYVSVNTRAAGGAWSVQGAMTQGDLSSWIVAGSYQSIDSSNHAYELGLSYSTQRYDGGNATALGAIRDSTRNVGLVYGHDNWTISPRLVLGYGARYARYDYLSGPGVWSPEVSMTIPLDGFRLKALASRRSLVPGAEEFAPSVTGLWLPPERTFSSLSSDGRFTVEETRHLQFSLERDLAAGVSVSIRGFEQRVNDQLVELFNTAPGHSETQLGHYYVANAGDLDAVGWGAAMTQEVPGYLRGTIEYTVTTARWDPSSDVSMMRAVYAGTVGLNDKIHDVLTTVEATIPQSATRVSAKYRINSAFWSAQPDALLHSSANARFSLRVNQSLPFLRFGNADWEALVDVRNMFREADSESSIYDEAFAIRAPKRIVGGLLVKF